MDSMGASLKGQSLGQMGWARMRLLIAQILERESGSLCLAYILVSF